MRKTIKWNEFVTWMIILSCIGTNIVSAFNENECWGHSIVQSDTKDVLFPINADIRSPSEFDKVDELILCWPKQNVDENYSCEPFIVQIIAAAQDAVQVKINVNKYPLYSREANHGIGGIIPRNNDRPFAVLNTSGIPLTNITIAEIMTSSIWMRDYGPTFVTQNLELSIVDFNYHGWLGGRFLDNVYPTRYGDRYHIHSSFLANFLLTIQAGNYISDGKGTGFLCWDRLHRDNPKLSQEQVTKILQHFLGLQNVVFLESQVMPVEQYGDQTGHIDMFAKLINNDTFLVAEWRDGDPWTNGTMKGITDRNAQQLEDMGYTIIRIPTIRDPNDPHTIWSYTNSLIINGTNNKIVLVPQYGATEDTEVITIYQSAMPGYEIRGIDCTEIIKHYGAIHCTTITRPVVGS
jgi:agmatine deiminase